MPVITRSAKPQRSMRSRCHTARGANLLVRNIAVSEIGCIDFVTAFQLLMHPAASPAQMRERRHEPTAPADSDRLGACRSPSTVNVGDLVAIHFAFFAGRIGRWLLVYSSSPRSSPSKVKPQ